MVYVGMSIKLILRLHINSNLDLGRFLCKNAGTLETWWSGLTYLFAKEAGPLKPSRVRIPPSPQRIFSIGVTQVSMVVGRLACSCYTNPNY